MTGSVRWAACFVGLAFAFSWVPLGIVAVTTGDPTATPESVALWALAGLGPGLAAFVVATASEGRRGLATLLRGLRHWRVGRWYALLLAPLPVALAAVLIAVAVGPARLELAGPAEVALLPVLLLNGIAFGGLEEIGWRGYLLPRLQEHASALVASVLVGLVWSMWHAPLFLLEGTSQASASLFWFTVQAVALSILATWAYNGSDGSVLLLIGAHGALNASYAAAVRWLAPEALATFTPYAALLVAACAAVVLWRYGPESLSRRPRQRWSAGGHGDPVVPG